MIDKILKFFGIPLDEDNEEQMFQRKMFLYKWRRHRLAQQS